MCEMKSKSGQVQAPQAHVAVVSDLMITSASSYSLTIKKHLLFNRQYKKAIKFDFKACHKVSQFLRYVITIRQLTNGKFHSVFGEGLAFQKSIEIRTESLINTRLFLSREALK